MVWYLWWETTILVHMLCGFQPIKARNIASHRFLLEMITPKFLLVVVSADVVVAINLITVIIGQNPIYGYFTQNPAYDVAFDHLKMTYPELSRNVSRHLIYKPGMYICNDAAALMYSVAGEIYALLRKLEGFTILLSPGNWATTIR